MVRVLVVDDSRFFRRRVVEILNADRHIEVVDTAENGREAIAKVKACRPDVVTMDVEMPVLDGIAAVKRIMADAPTPILMFSSLTTDGAQATLDALDAGAIDFLPKNIEDISKDKREATRQLCARVRLVGVRGLAVSRIKALVREPVAEGVSSDEIFESRTIRPQFPASKLEKNSCKIVILGTSTGGPVALQDVLSKLPGNFSKPILLVQHMPGTFTPAFAARLNTLCAIQVKQAENGEKIKPGTAYLAPGGKQMIIESVFGVDQIKILDGQSGQNYKPCVDITFNSVAKLYSKQSLVLVLTGMGADGREGTRTLKQGGSMVWAQDEQSSVVFGMPAAIIDAGLADRVMALKDIGRHLAEWA